MTLVRSSHRRLAEMAITETSVDLLVMRHGKSSWDSGAATDFARPLSSRGLRDAPRMAQWLRESALRPDRVLTSSALRALQTSDAVAAEFGLPSSAVEVDRRFYGCGPATWFEALRNGGERRVLICGHNPGLDELVEVITADRLRYTRDAKLMTTAAIAHLRLPRGWSSIGLTSARLITLQRPRDL